MEDIRYVIGQSSIELYLPTKNKGKFRWKNRTDNSQFGAVFATATIPFTEESYIEWQIGYDSEVNHAKKTTILGNLEFVGANGKIKNPYELSEILYLMKQSNIITKEDVKNLIIDIEKRDFSFDEQYRIKTSQKEVVTIADFKFYRQDIILPTFSDYKTGKSISIEISIQKQQYASGVQPMVYLCIPIQCFQNYKLMIGKTSRDIDEAKLVIDDSNKEFVFNLFKYFGICSSRHKHDMLSILQMLK